MSAQFGNVITAMVTPFNTDNSLDIPEAIRVAQHLADTGTDTVLLAGTTGESPTLSHQEEFQLFSSVSEALNGQAKVIAGTGSNSTKTAIESTQKAAESGVSGCLQVVPYYNKPSQSGLIQHFTAVANQSELPIILYNIPGRTGVNMEPETILSLSKHPRIVGIKESAGSIEQMQHIRDLVDDDFDIYCGDDALTLPFLRSGACGVVSVAAHCVGKQIQSMVQLYKNGDTDQAESIFQRLMPFFEVLFVTSNPSPVKSAMLKLGFSVGAPRLPLVELTETQDQQLTTVMKSLNII